jgi:N-acetylglutamate synthase-like GNAT family acetyltransferase
VILERPSVVPFGTAGVVTVVKDGASKQEVIVWESRRNLDDTITPFRIAEHEVPTFESKSIEACAIATTHAEGDLVTSNLAVVGGLQGALQLRAWRIGDRP